LAVPTAATQLLKVLVVDDNDDTRDVLRRMLEVRGLAVAEAANGEAAVNRVQRLCPDLILLDLNMPHMDGLEAAKLIRAVCADRDVRIVALTAFDTYGMEEAAKEAGCDGYFLKPISPELLDKLLRQFLLSV
jgi:two-component system, cell cycle response regulator DivK